MVNVGGPSKGCLTCISRKIRCDRQRPSCGQCIKSNRQCGGYRKSTDLIFRDQSKAVASRALADAHARNASPSGSRTPRKTLNAGTSQARSASASQSSSSERSVSVPRSPTPDEDSTAIEFFANNYSCTNTPAGRTNLFWIPPNFDGFLKDESVRLSARCTGMMAIARLQRSATYSNKAQGQYVIALQTLNKMWPQGVSHQHGAPFLAVLCLGFFEVLAAFDASSREAWRTHLGGLITLLIKTSQQFFSSPFGMPMFRQTRSQIIVYALQSCTPVVEAFNRDCPGKPWTKHFDDVDMLLIRLANLQAQCHTFANTSSLPELLLLDKDLMAWINAIPPSMTYSRQPREEHAAPWWDARCDIYPSGFIAYAWNKVRAARIVLHDLIRAILQSAPERATDSDYAPYCRQRGGMSVINQQLVIDICATIPLSYRPIPANTARQDSNLPPLGNAFWFIWPLEVIGRMFDALPELKQWIIQSLERIYALTGTEQIQRAASRLRDGHQRPVPFMRRA